MVDGVLPMGIVKLGVAPAIRGADGAELAKTLSGGSQRGVRSAPSMSESAIRCRAGCAAGMASFGGG